MSKTIESKNKALVLKAFDTLFNKRDYAEAERYWSPDYVQHSAHIAPGREGLFNLIKSIPPTLKYEPGTIVAEGDFVIVHGRFSGFGQPANWIAADILRIKDGILVEHWDVIQDEATEQQSKSGLPMFGEKFPTRAVSKQWGAAIFVGESVGDDLDFWAEGGDLVLPNSRLTLRYSNGFHKYSTADYPSLKPYFM